MTTDLATLPYTMADLDRHDAEMLVTGSGTLDMARLRATVAALDAARAEVAALDRHWVAKFAAESARAETLRRECDAAATQALSDSRRATQAEATAARLADAVIGEARTWLKTRGGGR